jgi:hypothetical protein
MHLLYRRRHDRELETIFGPHDWVFTRPDRDAIRPAERRQKAPKRLPG